MFGLVQLTERFDRRVLVNLAISVACLAFTQDMPLCEEALKTLVRSQLAFDSMDHLE